MKALICEEPGKFKYFSKEEPVASAGRAILKVRQIGICGTDLHAFEGTQPYFEYPRILGHELACEIADIESNTEFRVGDKVTFIPYFNCGECVACRNGLTNCCANIRVCGVHVDGGMTEYISVPINSLVQGRDMSLDELSLVEPLAIGAHGVRRGDVKYGEFVLVVGAGPIGLAVMEFAKIAGGRVIAIDMNERRLEFCKSELKIPYTINPTNANVMQELKEITNNDMPTVVIDASGSLKAINSEFQYMAHGARYVLVGLQKGEVSFIHPEFHKREASLMSSRNATRADFEYVINCMSNKLIFPVSLITHRVQFDEVKDQFNTWLDPSTGVIKAMVEMN